VFEGVFRKHMVVKGRRRDTAWYSLLDEEWSIGLGEGAIAERKGKKSVRESLEEWLGGGNFDEEGRQRRRLEDIREGTGV